MAPSLAAISIESGHVIAGITLIVLPIAAVAFARSGNAWREIGKGPFAIEQELPPARSAPSQRPLDRRVQEVETRQMLEAKSYRRARSGGPPIDVEAEMARLLDDPAPATGHDEALRAEVRQLVIVRNERRMRRGEEPLDVEAETERQLADLLGSG
jgi:hypothetical protein